MKKIFYIFLVLAMALTAKSAVAQTPTSVTPIPTKRVVVTLTPTAVPTTQDSTIEKIKDLVASRVAELKLVDKRGIVGTVKNVSNTQLTLNGVNNQQFVVDIDELTKFDGGTDNTFGISDIKNGNVLSVIGLYNKQTERILARFTEVASNIPQNFGGVVVAKDAEEFTITVAGEDGKPRIINIETSTKTSIYEDGETIKSGFTKIMLGERVIVVGFKDKTDETQINASRLIHFPDLALNQELKDALEKNDVKVEPTQVP